MQITQQMIDDACEAEEQFDADELETFAMFQRFKEQARELPLSEIKRHASASTDNRHKCQSCFCCACVEALAEL